MFQYVSSYYFLIRCFLGVLISDLLLVIPIKILLVLPLGDLAEHKYL